jgi:long-chain acyl-CoA synthetase
MLPSTEGISHLHTGGFFHFSGASPLWYTTMAAGTQVVLPKFEPVAVMKAIDEFRVSNTVLVPTMVNMLMNHPEFENFDLSSLRTCIYGAAPMPETLILRTMDKLPTWQFYQIYGMTESGGYATMLRWTDHLPSSGPASKLRSCGRPAPGFEVRIVHPDGSLAPAGKIGEIVLRSDILMDGYLGDAAATAATIRDGWLYSGDAGYLDEDGFLYVADRIKDMIVTGGENVYSVEVERALYQHPAISEAAVIGLPSEKWGETVHAVVVLRAGTSATEQEIIAHCRELIGGYKCPRSVDVRSQPLPMTPVGKIRKNVLRDECLGRGDISSSAA